MKLTKEMLTEMEACPQGFRWFIQQNETDVGKLIDIAIANLDNDVFSYANWGIARLLPRPDQIRYAVFMAELVLPIFETERPNDDRPRKAVEAAKAVIENDSEENRKAAAAAYAAAAAAYAAADAAAYAAAAAANAYAAAAAAAADAVAAAAAAADAAAAAAYDAYDAYAAAAAADAVAAAAAAGNKKREVQKKILEYGKSLLLG